MLRWLRILLLLGLAIVAIAVVGDIYFDWAVKEYYRKREQQTKEVFGGGDCQAGPVLGFGIDCGALDLKKLKDQCPIHIRIDYPLALSEAVERRRAEARIIEALVTPTKASHFRMFGAVFVDDGPQTLVVYDSPLLAVARSDCGQGHLLIESRIAAYQVEFPEGPALSIIER